MAKRTAPSPLALFAIAIAFFGPVVYTTALLAGYWTLRAALLPVVAGVGSIQLARLAWHGPMPHRRAARAGAGFLLVGLLSALLSHNHTVAFFGLYDWGTGWIFMAALAGAWAIGASLPPADTRRVASALVAAVGVNVVFALAEILVDLRPFGLGLYQNRAPGLMGNPIQLGTLVSAGIALAAWRARERPAAWAVVVAGMAASLEVSGSRLGLIVAVAVVVLLAGRREWRIAGIVAIALALGFGAGLAVGAVGGGTTATARVQQSTTAGGVFGGRTATWWSARHAVADHPVLGNGPGQFRAATSRYHPLSVARQEGPDTLFADGHNFLVEYTVTTGLVGVIALLAWLGLAFGAGAGPLLAFALAGLACHLLEPQFAGVTPMVFLALGASAAARVVPPAPAAPAVPAAPATPAAPAVPAVPAALTAPAEPATPARTAASRALAVLTGVTALVGLAAGGALVVGDHRLQNASLDFTADQAQSADRILPRWPQALTELAHIYEFEAIAHRNDARYPGLVVATRQAAIRRDPTDPYLWNQLGGDYIRFGRWDDARGAFTEALRFDPWSVVAMNGLGTSACELGRAAEAGEWYRRSLSVRPDQPDIRRATSISCPPP